MGDLAVLTPSFKHDAGLFADLHESVLATTAPSVVHHVVVPPSDAGLFRQYEGPRCRIWTHRDLLPRHFVSVPRASGLTVNMRRPWLPVRGWVTQQIMKLAGTAAMEARAVLIIDSDAVLLRELSLQDVVHDGRPLHFRRERAVVAGMRRHLLWHNVARTLLGVPGQVSAPAPDYISPIAVWDPAVVRALMAHVGETTGKDWFDAVGGELHVSEFMLYGVFVDHVLGGIEPFGGPLCHNYYARVPLSREDARTFADQMPAQALGSMISSHSQTPRDVRHQAFRWCSEMVDGAGRSAPEWPADSTIARGSGRYGCIDAALLLAHLYTAAPLGLA